MRCRYWIFDMDGTLTDSMGPVWRAAPIALLAQYGIEAEPGLAEKLLTMTLAEGADYLRSTYPLPLDDEGYAAAVRDVVPKLYETVELKPGVRELIARLQSEGAQMCICSNTWEAQCRTVLGRLGIADAFSFYLTAQGEYSKSKPAVFHEAMRRMGATDPAECAVCEDSLYAARTARAEGFTVIGIADDSSRASADELRETSDQYLDDWTQLDWTKV